VAIFVPVSPSADASAATASVQPCLAGYPELTNKGGGLG